MELALFHRAVLSDALLTMHVQSNSKRQNNTNIRDMQLKVDAYEKPGVKETTSCCLCERTLASVNVIEIHKM